MSIRRLVLAAFCLSGVAAFAVPAHAQDPESPAEETPSLSTEDVAPSSSSELALPKGNTAAAAKALDRLGDELVRKGASPEDVRALRARVDAGGEVTFGVRFDVDGQGNVVGMTQDVGTGFASIDRLAAQDLGRDSGRMDFLAGFNDVHISVGIASGGVRLRASGTAPSVEKATQLESFVTKLREQAANQSAMPDIRIDRDGQRISFAVAVPYELLAGNAP